MTFGNSSPLDRILIGNGLAPLIATLYFLNQGKRVALLNPDSDFFLEDSEFPVDPLIPIRSYLERPTGRIERSLAQVCFDELKPFYPGTLEFQKTGYLDTRSGAYHDESAPHLRTRNRVWLSTPFESMKGLNHELLEDIFLNLSDSGLNPQLLEGLPAIRRFPGAQRAILSSHLAGARAEGQGLSPLRSVQLVGGYDLDLDRYRTGILEFVLERLGPERVFCGVSQLDFGGAKSEPFGRRVRCHYRGQSKILTAEKTLVFWTPKLTRIVSGLLDQDSQLPNLQRKVRLWEKWKIKSQDPVDPIDHAEKMLIGAYREMTLWSSQEGCPKEGCTELNIMRAGPIFNHEEILRDREKATWMNRESYQELRDLLLDLLKWQSFMIRKLTTSLTFVPQSGDSVPIQKGDLHVVRRVDGPVGEVVRRTRLFCEGV